MTNKLPEVGKRYRDKETKEIMRVKGFTDQVHYSGEMTNNCTDRKDFWDQFEELPNQELKNITISIGSIENTAAETIERSINKWLSPIDASEETKNREVTSPIESMVNDEKQGDFSENCAGSKSIRKDVSPQQQKCDTISRFARYRNYALNYIDDQEQFSLDVLKRLNKLEGK